ncbi:hypothetical protein F4U02_13220 [Acinetobacter haemolyticus]|uniref:hypothetical protein n=1 Tax=Acinetobacter haemolyticus TaxID=29430 RepID=UPI000F761EC8|nr:hypothetical protein [Acinetobacter haemolyticus]AZN67014.1 hypothetical protein DX910_00485 [Acinetobacter haemolyticus]MQZ31945.1 hypothetical protein [Acinetobacter haemolyticus]
MEPLLQLDWSDDNGHTWSENRLLPLGKKGEYRKRVSAKRLGAGRDRVFRIRCSEPINIVIIEGRLE